MTLGRSRGGKCAFEGKRRRAWGELLVADPTAENAEPMMFARRHGKLYLWPVPDGVYTVNVDYAAYHPETFEDILFGPEFNEAIFEGVIPFRVIKFRVENHNALL